MNESRKHARFLFRATPGASRIRLMVQPITYSPDGSYAIVHVGASAFVHAMGVDFLLRRNAVGWEIALVQNSP